MNAWESIRKSQSTVFLFFVTVLIIPFQVLILGYVLANAINMQTLAVSFGTDTYPYLAGYFVLTIVYCIFMSLYMSPKRMVSPINVQVGVTVIISTFLIFWSLTRVTISTTAEALIYLGNLSLIIVLSGFFLVALGFFQYIIVWLVVALNLESVDQLSFQINTKTEDVMSILGDEFLDVWEFNRRKDNPKAKKKAIWILKCRDTYGNRVVLAVGPDFTNKGEDKCVLATVAYHTSLYSIKSSTSALGMRTSIVNDVKERLLKSDPNVTLSQMATTSDPVSSKAYSNAIASTRPKTEMTREFLRHIPRYYLYGILITVAAIAFMTILFALGYLDRSTFVGALIVLVVALLAELGVSLREELGRQEVEELD